MPLPAVCLLYHAIGAPGPGGAARFSLSTPAFASHLATLTALTRSGQIQVVDLAAWWSGAAPAAPREVVLCFDDGGLSDYRFAFPMLAEAGLPATFFINTAHVGRAGYLDWPQIQTMQRAGMSIQSHGHEHVPLCRLSAPTLERQLRISRHTLQQHAGRPVQFLAAPYGLWNRRVLETALGCGFMALCTSHAGVAAAGNPVLPRNALWAETSAAQLQGWVRGRPASFAGRRGREALLWLPKQILLHYPGWPAPATPSSTSTY